jgi:hypothetical protein
LGIVFMEVERFDCIDKLMPQIEICAFFVFAALHQWE